MQDIVKIYQSKGIAQAFEALAEYATAYDDAHKMAYAAQTSLSSQIVKLVFALTIPADGQEWPRYDKRDSLKSGAKAWSKALTIRHAMVECDKLGLTFDITPSAKVAYSSGDLAGLVMEGVIPFNHISRMDTLLAPLFPRKKRKAEAAKVADKWRELQEVIVFHKDGQPCKFNLSRLAFIATHAATDKPSFAEALRRLELSNNAPNALVRDDAVSVVQFATAQHKIYEKRREQSKDDFRDEQARAALDAIYSENKPALVALLAEYQSRLSGGTEAEPAKTKAA